MNRFFLITALAASVAAGCVKGSDTASKEAERGKPADTLRTEDKPADPRVEQAMPPPPVTSQGDITGSYTALGALPAPFSELDHLLLATIDENAKPAPLNGFLRPKDMKAKDYTLVDPKMDGKKLTFSTVVNNGVSYSFDGMFERTDSFDLNPPSQDTPILKGTLTRMKDGKREAETPVEYAYTPGG